MKFNSHGRSFLMSCVAGAPCVAGATVPGQELDFAADIAPASDSGGAMSFLFTVSRPFCGAGL